MEVSLIGRRSVQAAEEESCTAADMYFRSQTVTTECCDEPNEDCSGGSPHTCNAGCAQVLVPFFTECSALLGPAVDTFNATVALCREAIEHEQTVERCNGPALTTMISACCKGNVQGNGHRRELQIVESCGRLSSACSTICAPIFIDYFRDCNGVIAEGRVQENRNIFSSFHDMYNRCQDTQVSAEAPQPQHTTKNNMSIALMLNGSMNAEAVQLIEDLEARVSTLENKLENELPNRSAMEARVSSLTAAEARTSSKANWLENELNNRTLVEAGLQRQINDLRTSSLVLSESGCDLGPIVACFPPCTVTEFGTQLGLRIGERLGTVLICTVFNGVYGWNTLSSSTNGYFGDDVTLFMGALGSAATGLYDLTLVKNESVATSITVHARQNAQISARQAVQSPLAWGTGDFIVGESATLSLRHVQLEVPVHGNEGASYLSITDCLVMFDPQHLLDVVSISVVQYSDVYPQNNTWTLEAAESVFTFTVTGDVGDRVGLSTHPGQDLRIVGDRSLPSPPSWGIGAFIVSEASSLSVSFLQVDTLITTREGTRHFQLDDCEITFTGTLILRAAEASFPNQIFKGRIIVPNDVIVSITGSNLTFAQPSNAPKLTVQSGGSLLLTQTTLAIDGESAISEGPNGLNDFTSLGMRTWMLRVEEGGNVTVQNCQMQRADGTTDPFPCDGARGVCTRSHDGSVEVSGFVEINVAAPLVCNLLGECVSDMCEIVDCGDHGHCASPHGDCGCDLERSPGGAEPRTGDPSNPCVSDLCTITNCGEGGTCESPQGTCACSHSYSGDLCQTHACCRGGACYCHCGASCGSCHCNGGGSCSCNGSPTDQCLDYCDQHIAGWDAECDRTC
eukprot:SAG22_NODE_1754_length_3656_cov_4.574360_2_plen_852_part_00